MNLPSSQGSTATLTNRTIASVHHTPDDPTTTQKKVFSVKVTITRNYAVNFSKAADQKYSVWRTFALNQFDQAKKKQAITFTISKWYFGTLIHIKLQQDKLSGA